jgi:hypothetical protein
MIEGSMLGISMLGINVIGDGLPNGSKGRHVHDNDGTGSAGGGWFSARRCREPGTKSHGLGAMISRSAPLQFANYWV